MMAVEHLRDHAITTRAQGRRILFGFESCENSFEDIGGK